MRISSGIWMTAFLLASVPSFAGNLALENGRNIWIPSCTKPTSPASVLNAHPETAGNEMNSISAQQNAYVDAMQAYMNCISNDAQQDQMLINQAITSSAQKAISEAMAEANASSPAAASRRNWNTR